MQKTNSSAAQRHSSCQTCMSSRSKSSGASGGRELLYLAVLSSVLAFHVSCAGSDSDGPPSSSDAGQTSEPNFVVALQWQSARDQANVPNPECRWCTSPVNCARSITIAESKVQKLISHYASCSISSTSVSYTINCKEQCNSRSVTCADSSTGGQGHDTCYTCPLVPYAATQDTGSCAWTPPVQ